MGKRLVNQLIDDGYYQVHCLDLTIPPMNKRISSVRSYIQTDITNKQHMVEALSGMDVVFHTASIVPTVEVTDEDMNLINIVGTRNVIEACKENGVKRLIYTSSTCVVLSKDPNKVCEDVEENQSLPEDPLNIYVRTKGIAETLVVNANEEDGLCTCALRLAGLLGGTDSRIMMTFMSRCVVQLSQGQARISWVEVNSAANAHVVADKRLRETVSGSSNPCGNQVAGKAYNISISDKFHVGELYRFFAKENGRPLIILPSWVVKSLIFFNVHMYNVTGIIPLHTYLNSAGVDFLQSHFTVSTEKAKRELGWEDRRPWREIVRELIMDYKAKSESHLKA